MQKGLGAQPRFPSPNLWHLGMGGTTKRRSPNSTIGGRLDTDSDGLGALCCLKVVPLFSLRSLIVKRA